MPRQPRSLVAREACAFARRPTARTGRGRRAAPRRARPARSSGPASARPARTSAPCNSASTCLRSASSVGGRRRGARRGRRGTAGCRRSPARPVEAPRWPGRTRRLDALAASRRPLRCGAASRPREPQVSADELETRRSVACRPGRRTGRRSGGSRAAGRRSRASGRVRACRCRNLPSRAGAGRACAEPAVRKTTNRLPAGRHPPRELEQDSPSNREHRPVVAVDRRRSS